MKKSWILLLGALAMLLCVRGWAQTPAEMTLRVGQANMYMNGRPCRLDARGYVFCPAAVKATPTATPTPK